MQTEPMKSIPLRLRLRLRLPLLVALACGTAAASAWLSPDVVPERQFLENSTHARDDATRHGVEQETETPLWPPCHDVLLHDTDAARCHHARHCDGENIMTTLLPFAFCTDASAPAALASLFPLLFPLSLFAVTLLLFRLLGSTAENYFSPALEMMTSEFHIPPALAGVTLLALGNGAPDVSAVVNAIKMGAAEGIPLSLGELTGGGMFVQTVVVGRIVFLNAEEGVTCRGELLRDMTMYAISAGYVLWICRQGAVFYHHVLGMALLYLAYVGVIFVFEIRRYYSTPMPDHGGNGDWSTNEEGEELPCGDDSTALMHPSTPTADEDDQTVELSPRRELPSLGRSTKPDPPGIKQSARVLRVMQKQQQRRRRQRLSEARKSRAVEDTPDPQDRSGSTQHSDQRPWSCQLVGDSLHELGQHFYTALYCDIWSNAELSRLQWFCLSIESPFIILRKLVIPIPCEAEYHRSLVACSLALSPLWLFFYFSIHVNPMNPFHVIPCCLSLATGCAVLRYAPKEDTASMPLRYSLPIALYGFFVAATWIDVISDQLINVLELIGVLFRIPTPIMGMTVLAWGNSVGDYTTNGALAQRGLADMSMTACFAGPSFNLLIGLGCGLLTQKESLLSSDGLPIFLGTSVHTGFAFLICNCVITVFCGIWNKGLIPKMHGYVFYAMYFAYMTMNARNLTIH